MPLWPCLKQPQFKNIVKQNVKYWHWLKNCMNHFLWRLYNDSDETEEFGTMFDYFDLQSGSQWHEIAQTLAMVNYLGRGMNTQVM